MALRNLFTPAWLLIATIGSICIKKDAKKPTQDGLAPRPSIPESPPPGTGDRTLANLCTSYSLDVKQVVRELKRRQIDASELLTIKMIAADTGMGPMDLYEVLKDIAGNAME